MLQEGLGIWGQAGLDLDKAKSRSKWKSHHPGRKLTMRSIECLRQLLIFFEASLRQLMRLIGSGRVHVGE